MKRSAPEPYLPRKDAEALFRVHTFRVLDGKRPKAEDAFVEAVRAALTSPGPVKALDHAHIWDAAASRLYDAYIARPEYYLNECEKEILRIHAGAIAERHAFFVELEHHLISGLETERATHLSGEHQPALFVQCRRHPRHDLTSAQSYHTPSRISSTGRGLLSIARRSSSGVSVAVPIFMTTTPPA